MRSAKPYSSGRKATEHWELRVQDEGIGFDEKYLDRIFAPFQRLHGRNEFEGTGMGLAICRKIAESHWGSITAESAVGQGAVFIVTLPTMQPVVQPTIESRDGGSY
jgi:signal transduction histidine kinase